MTWRRWRSVGAPPYVEARKVPDVSGRVVGAADVATAACGADRPAPIALDRASRRPTSSLRRRRPSVATPTRSVEQIKAPNLTACAGSVTR